MSFQIPDGLSPEVYPLSWLLGRWRGPGFIVYPGIPERGVLVEAQFYHDGGPYLQYTATTYLLDSPLDSLEGTIDFDSLQAGQVWSSESGYWRTAPSAPDDARELTDPAAPASDGPPERELEVLLSEPTGHVSVYLGTVTGPRITLTSDVIARTASAAEITAGARMYGLVGGELMWALDLAAFGHELQSYASGRMQRVVGSEAQDGEVDDDE